MVNALEVRNLSVEFELTNVVIQAVRGVSFDLAPGERLGLVGESGSGKTTTALALMRMIEPPGRIVSGEVRLDGQDLLDLNDEQMREARLNRISYIPQGAMNSLNPVIPIGEQLLDGVRDHGQDMDRTQADALKARLLTSVGLDPSVADQFAHELSGGMKQRVCIAIGIALEPTVIVADEPSSALDVVSQRQVMQTLGELQTQMGAALILIGHDMGLMAQFVDRVAVMRNGEILEDSPTRELFSGAKHAYSRKLIEAVPKLGTRMPLSTALPVETSGPPILEFRNVNKSFGKVEALSGISFALDSTPATITAIAGQSGSGKSTLGLMALGLEQPTKGQILISGKSYSDMTGAEKRLALRDMQAVFQDPFSSFNPFYRVERTLTLPLRRFGLANSREEARSMVEDACRVVGLKPEDTLQKFPHLLSGGQRQRLMVARALTMRPRLLVADEPVSMIDASLRASILDSLKELRDDFGIPILYITHDLTTAYHVSDHTMILYRGRFAEVGQTADVIGDPRHPYTKLLIDSIPWPDLDHKWGGDSDASIDTAAAREAFASPTVMRSLSAGLKLPSVEGRANV